MIIISFLLAWVDSKSAAEMPIQQVGSLTIDASLNCRIRGDGIVTVASVGSANPAAKSANAPNYSLQTLSKKNGLYLIPVNNNGYYSVSIATKSSPRTIHLWDKELNLIRDIPVSIGINSPNIEDLNLYFIQETFTLVVNGKDAEIPSAPGIEIQTFRGFDKDLNIYFACSSLKIDDIGYKEGKAFFAWYDQKDWHFPKTPAGYRHSFLRGISDNGYGRVICSKQSTGAASGLLINGYEQVGAEHVVSLTGVPRFFKQGKWYGETPPPIPTGKRRWKQEHQAVERWSNLALYETTMTSGDEEMKKLRGKYHGKWVSLNGLTANRTVDYSKYELSGIRDGYLLLEEKTTKATKRLVVLKSRF